MIGEFIALGLWHAVHHGRSVWWSKIHLHQKPGNKKRKREGPVYTISFQGTYQ
jgi:hypothetical protein